MGSREMIPQHNQWRGTRINGHFLEIQKVTKTFLEIQKVTKTLKSCFVGYAKDRMGYGTVQHLYT